MGEELNVYRFKTKEEFKKEFGDNWRHRVYAVWTDGMDYLLGKPYPHDIRFLDYLKDVDHWHISKDMITKIIIIPNYTPKKRIERTL